MAVVPVTINGVAYPKNKKDPPMPVTIVGYAWITGLTVGGGPVVLPDPPTEPPITDPPPDHPLDQLMTMVAKEPPPEGGWSWMPEYGWLWYPGEGAAQPKSGGS